MRRLYVNENRTEREMATILGISRTRVAEAMVQAGIPRRSTRKPCPVTRAALTKLFSAPEATTASIARHFAVADATAARWLAEAGLVGSNAHVDHRRLEKLYAIQGLTVRDVADKLHVSPAVVRHEMVVAGIPARSNRFRPPRGNRAKVTDKKLVDLYVRQQRSVNETAAILGVSTEYLGKRLDEVGLVKRAGSFTPRTAWDPEDLRDRAADLYQDGLSMKGVGELLGVSVGTVRTALHHAGVPVRRGGFNSHLDEGRTLLDDLYSDPRIRKVLARYRVVVPDTWTPTGPFEALAPLPLDDGVVRALYDDIGLPMFPCPYSWAWAWGP